MIDWTQFCPYCMHYDGSGVCSEFHFNVKSYPKKFVNLCGGNGFKQDPDAEQKKASAPDSEKTEKKPVRHRLFTAINIKDASHPGEKSCTCCGTEETRYKGEFHFGQKLNTRSKQVYMGTEYTSTYRILGSKALLFCEKCLDDLAIEKKKLKNKTILQWIFGFLAWMIIWMLSALIKVPIIFGGIFVAGILLALRFVPRMMRNNHDWAALTKGRGEGRPSDNFYEYLDNEALKHFSSALPEESLRGYTFWTRRGFNALKKQNQFNT